MNIFTANINPETGVHYGIISSQKLDSDVVDMLLYGAQAEDETAKQALAEALQDKRNELEDSDEDPINYDEILDFHEEEFWEDYHSEEPSIAGTLEGVTYRSSWLGGALHFFIFDGKHTSLRPQCSPCVPNVGNLDQDIDEAGVMTYDVPEDWRIEDLN